MKKVLAFIGKFSIRNEGLRSKARSLLFSLQKKTHSSPGLKALESSAAENKLSVDYSEHFLQIVVVNLALVIFQFIYLSLRYKFLNSVIPFWYVMSWGTQQLSTKSHIFLIPFISLIILVLGIIFSILSKKYHLRYGLELILATVTASNFLLLYSLFKIINTSSIAFDPLLDPSIAKLVMPLLTSAALVYLITPKFIEYAKEKGTITDPSIHEHPGMILKKPSARGGGVIFSLAFVLVSTLFIPFSKQTVALYLAVLFTALISFLDDIANTNPSTKYKLFGNALFRLLVLQPLSILFLLAAQIKIFFIGNPFDGLLLFDKFKINLGGFVIAPIAAIITLVWILWIMNMISFSNGVDGQYSGIVGISAIVIAFLALRSSPNHLPQQNIAILGAIMAGASFGLIPYTWHPSKIMWSFGATSAGLILASLSIMAGAKIATSTIVLLIPFMDALITVVRRIIQRKAPYKGDRGHLHHLLLDRGWSPKKIAVFYWITTAVFGIIALISSDKALPLIIMTASGVVAFSLIVLNLKSKKDTQISQISGL